MKKLFILCFCLTMSVFAHAQKADAESLAAAANLGHDSYSDRAKEYAQKYKLNEKGEWVFTDVLNIGATKEEMYDNVINWLMDNCTDAAECIVEENEAEGHIVMRCYFGKMAYEKKDDLKEWVSIRPLLGLDIADQVCTVTFTIPNYEVFVGNDKTGRVLAGGTGSFYFSGDVASKDETIWPLKKCFPWNDGESEYNKSTCAKACVHAFECYRLAKQQVLNAGFRIKRKKK